MNHPLLQKASIVFTPTAYGTSTLNSIKPVYTLGTELVTNGTFDTDSNWTKGTGWTISGGVASCDGTQSSTSTLNTTVGISGITNKKVKLSFDIKNYQAGSLTVTLEGTGGNEFTGLNSDGVYEIEATSTDSLPKLLFNANSSFIGSVDNASIKLVTDADFDFSRSTTATRVNEAGLIEEVAAHIPRIDFLSGVGVSLNEWQSTNTCTYSNDFTQGDIFGGSAAPNAVNSVITATSTTSPDGTNNGWKLTDNNDSSSGTVQMAYYSVDVTSGDSNTFSIFVKKGSLDFAYIVTGGFDSTANATSYFNISTGVVTVAAANHKGVKIEDYGNGWYRISVANRTTTDVKGAFTVGMSEASGANTAGTRDGTKFMYMFGVQAEAEDDTDVDYFLTSYIPTSGATFTRIKDKTIDSGNSDLINSPEGVLYINLAGNARKFVSTRRISLSDGTNDNAVRFDFGTVEDRITMRVRVGGSNVTTETNTGNYNISEFHKYAIQWKENDFKIYIDGVEVHTDTTGSSFPANTLDRLNLASYAEGSNIEAKIKCVAVFKEILTDAELVTLTS